MTISALKALFEDYKRHKSDNEENNKNTFVFRGSGFHFEHWKNIQVGDIIKVTKNQPLPCDIILLYSSDAKGRCYVETKNLDGETNLKPKYANKDIAKHFTNNANISNFRNTTFDYDRPNPYLYHFKGTGTLGHQKISIDYSNFLLRGSSLRNTEFVYGLVVYTGHETKIMLNSTKAKPKRSDVEKKLSTMVFIIFIILVIFCLFTALYARIGLQLNTSASYYLHFRNRTAPFLMDILYRLGNWILIFNNFVPISMLVTLELIRFIQAAVLSSDPKMVTEDIEPAVQSSNLNEELGQVEYMFSDKTGTLTSNQMIFKKLSVNGTIYGGINDMMSMSDANYSVIDEKRPYCGVENVDFDDPNFLSILDQPKHQENKNIVEMLIAQALCHTVMVEHENGKSSYSASSPDELALVNFAKFCGYEYKGTDEHNIMTIQARRQERTYRLLNVFEFSSDRKRMSIIVEDENQNIILFCKGADSIIFDRLTSNTSIRLRETTNFSLKCFGNEGLRTLLYSSRTLSSDEYRAWAERYHEASTSMIDREHKMETLQAEIERELVLLGATGIEDKLQDQVSTTIKFITDADIKLWVLTGDKVETARSIGRSCGLIATEMREVLIAHDTEDQLDYVFTEFENARDDESPYYVMITGEALLYLTNTHNKVLFQKFANVALEAKTVLACRVSPKQKQEVVELVRKQKPNVITLAIGDGANDVNMITAAHVGVGIKGKEGLQAARASDYCFGEFKHLKRLTFFYGREYYRKNTNVIFYNFYKNMILVLPQFWYGFTNIFSGQTLYETFLNQFFNTLFAALPIILYAVCDQQYDDRVFEKKPRLYDLGRRRLFFTYKNFLLWLANGAGQAFFIAILSFVLMQNISLNQTGYIADFWISGSLVFSLAVFNVNFKIFVMSYTRNMLIMLSLWGTLALYYLCLIFVANRRVTSEYYGILKISQRSMYYWATIVIILLITNGFDMVMARISFLDEEINNKPPRGSRQRLLHNEKRGDEFMLHDHDDDDYDRPANSSYVL